MVKWIGTFSKISPQKVLVAGDLMLDCYTMGKAKRISPEAPVAVLNVERQENRPGGAGNAVLNLVSMGAKVTLLGRVGCDEPGNTLMQALASEGIDLAGVIQDPSYPTPVKNRFIADNQQLIRVDYEKIVPLSEEMEQILIQKIPSLLEGIKIVAISDYGKGFLSKSLLKQLILHANQKNIPVVADPKGQDFSKYAGVFVLKPNLSEAYAASGKDLNTSLDDVAAILFEKVKIDHLMITRSQAGISIFDSSGKRDDLPVRVREVKDVTGAGDTVLAMLTYALANQLPLVEATQLANVAAGIAIEHFGCARVTQDELAERLWELDVTNKIFDEEHLKLLQQVLKRKKWKYLHFPACHHLSLEQYSQIKEAKKEDAYLVVSLSENVQKEFVEMLTALHEVDFVLLS